MAMASLESSIISTLAFYRALRVFSLTPLEILRYWTPLEVRPQPLADDGRHTGGPLPLTGWTPKYAGHGPSRIPISAGAVSDKPSLYELLQALAGMQEKGTVKCARGHYALANAPANFFPLRMQARKISMARRSTFHRIARFFPYIP